MRITNTRFAGLSVAALLFAAPILLAQSASAQTSDATGDALAQTVESSEQVVAEPAEVGVGHVDLGPKVVEGQWRMLARDDNLTPAVWRDPAALTLRVDDSAQLAVPDTEAFSFIPVGPKREAYVIPQTQMASVVWLGWNTQDPAVANSLDRGGELELRKVNGPGEVIVFLQNGFDDVTKLWDSTQALPQKFWVDANIHTHANWVFTEPGVYQLEIAFVGDLLDGTSVDVPAQMTFAVGTATDAADLPAPKADGGESIASGETESGRANHLPIWLGVAAGGVAVIAGVAIVALKTRRAKNNAA